MDRVEWVCLSNTTGYAQSARDYILALRSEYDLRVLSLNGKPDDSVISKKTCEAFSEMRSKPFKKDGVQVFQCIPDMQRRKRWIRDKCDKTVGFATFETSGPPEHWIQILNKNDAVIAPSRYCEKVFKDAGVETPIFYVPHVVDTDLYNENTESMLPSDQFTFLYIASFRDRKNFNELLKAWNNFFKDNNDVRLVIKTDHGDMLRNLVIKRCYGTIPDNLIILDHTMHEKEIPMLIKSADCLIHPSLGEGFGLPPLFAMAMKTPVAVAGHTGMLDYANEDNCTIIKAGDPEMPEKTMDNYPQFRKCKWHTVDYLTIYESMNIILRSPDIANRKALTAYEQVVHNYSYKQAKTYFDKLMKYLRR